MWSNRKTDLTVRDLVEEMRFWQEEYYVDRLIWTSNIFSHSLLSHHSSDAPDQGKENAPSYTLISEEERIVFENEDLDPVKWTSKLCKHLNMENLKCLKDVGKDKITVFLDRIKDTATRETLRVVLRELRCLHVPSFELKTLTDLPDARNKRMR